MKIRNRVDAYRVQPRIRLYAQVGDRPSEAGSGGLVLEESRQFPGLDPEARDGQRRGDHPMYRAHPLEGKTTKLVGRLRETRGISVPRGDQEV